MTLYNVLMFLGLVVMIGVVVKGFWGVTRLKPLEQHDSPQSDAAPPN
ncbi:hypothetical protein GA0061105_11139 [Rhizobium aethiopicum]|uniref:Uncharacterized protein n=1 Tax=Rhizobium aethiopicum TaxID=1138170 RepID=A0A1C3Y7N0_9HYPH|nr:hypothetical protein [Rhizobium aethiopicum]SCB60468.1 hypothetical protein GA0061105_11139 [Rhizobium aethiopicum]